MSSKLREALGEIKDAANSALTALSVGNCPSNFLWEIVRKCEAALAEPLRNCDVGSAEEQDERFDKFCESHINCAHCPLKGWQCSLVWSQMLYEEVAK